MVSSVSFVLDGKIETVDFTSDPGITPSTTVLNYLRSLPTHKGVKEGCAEGDCGACTVVLGEVGTDGRMRYQSVDSCLVFLPMIHGKHLVTVEDLKSTNGELHPVQRAMVETDGSQCGYCTPGIIMALFSLYKNSNHPTRFEIDDALTGNLCRCTGYRPIVEAAAKACVHNGIDQFTQQESDVTVLLQSIPKPPLKLTTKAQVYHQPATLDEALALKRDHPEAYVICGATDVALRVTKKHELLEKIIDLSAIPPLKAITESKTSISIGAGASLTDILLHIKQEFPALADMFAVFGSQQIRNLATLGGNVGTASPIGDTLSALIPYNASVVLASKSGQREISLDEFFTGYRQTLRRPDELIVSIILPKLTNGAHVKWYKVSKRKDLDISTVSAGFRLELDQMNQISGVKLVYGGMAERVKRAESTERFLLGKRWSREIVEQAMTIMDSDFKPISDARSGAEFRKVAARNLLLKFWSETAGLNGEAS